MPSTPTNAETTLVVDSTVTSKTSTNKETAKQRAARLKRIAARKNRLNVTVKPQFNPQAGIVYQERKVKNGDEDFTSKSLEVTVNFGHNYNYVVNQVFKLTSILSQNGAQQKDVDTAIAKLQQLIELSQKGLIERHESDKSKDTESNKK